MVHALAHPFRVAVLWRGDQQERSTAAPANSRLYAIFDALTEYGFRPEPAVYSEEFAAEVRQQLLQVDAVLVWVNPGANGIGRAILDALLRDVSAAGTFVSAHPDVIDGMGTAARGNHSAMTD